jgi:plastocyanin
MPEQQPRLVSTDDSAFDPDQLTITVGETVKWTNTADAEWHSATHTPASGAPLFNSPNLYPGDSFSFKFVTAGTYPYNCRHHPGMTGTITVT